MTATDAELEPYARRLCEIRGENPDVYVLHAHPVHDTLLTSSRRWELCAPELRAHMEVEQAITDVDRAFYENEYPKEGA